MPTPAVVEIGRQRLSLLPERAAWCAASRTLFVADLHWGKHATFRAHGLGLPEGDLAAELELLDGLIDRYRASTLAVLGDLVHDRHGLAQVVVDTVSAWRSRHAELRLLLVPGNHDRSVRTMPRAWRIEPCADPSRIGGWQCVHEPPTRATAPTLAGHLHPTVVLRQGAERLRLPAFRLEGRVLTLPAFTRFSSGVADRPGRGRRLFAITGDAVLEV